MQAHMLWQRDERRSVISHLHRSRRSTREAHHESKLYRVLSAMKFVRKIPFALTEPGVLVHGSAGALCSHPLDR